jgi:hypothetical protein
MKLKLPFAIVTVMMLSGCLKTRNEVSAAETRNVQAQQVATMQRTAAADAGNRLSEMEEQMRELNGRVDVVENKIGTSRGATDQALKGNQQQISEMNQKMSLLQEAMTKMEGQLFQLTNEVQVLRAEKAAQAAAAQADHLARQAKKDLYEVAQDFFKQKDWKQAILNYQKYRDENPKGKNFPDATYKIGVAFQELGMKEEARTFYDEVSAKFPKSEEAKRAKTRLKGLKK